MDDAEIMPELPLDIRRDVLLVSLNHVVQVVHFFKACCPLWPVAGVLLSAAFALIDVDVAVAVVVCVALTHVHARVLVEQMHVGADGYRDAIADILWRLQRLQFDTGVRVVP